MKLLYFCRLKLVLNYNERFNRTSQEISEKRWKIEMWKNKLKMAITKSKLNRNTLAEKTNIPIPITYNILTCNMQNIYTSKAGSVWKQVLQNYPATKQRTGRKASHSDSRQSSTAYFQEKFHEIHAKWHPKSKNKKEENNKENDKEQPAKGNGE